ncbi:urease accessory protein UreF [Tepidamorphus sp. 3E244]|uniref:urease accessory protein UreF n=1 Tax=Tepidamorphus sp. 3E244 TaxID=3385498 RepID=UPI0038FCBC19
MSASLIRLMNWLSPVFPTGGFAYSGGLEQASRDGTVTDETALGDWLAALIAHGTIRNDLVLLAAAWNAQGRTEPLDDLAATATALCGSEQRHLETVAQGAAFAQALASWPEAEQISCPKDTPLPVIVGAACAASHIELTDALSGFLQAFVSSQLQAAIRLSVIGQNGAARLLARLEPQIAEAASSAATSTLDDLGSCTFMADIAALEHETLDGRLFRS